MGYPHICGTVVAVEWQPSFIHLWPGIGCPDFLRPFEDTPPPSAIVTLEYTEEKEAMQESERDEEDTLCVSRQDFLFRMKSLKSS